MKDIARDLGVSVVTVSKVLRNHSDISAQTRKRVLQRMKELNYQPNPAARALVTGRTNLIGLIVPDLVHPFFAEVAKGISARLRSQEYSLIIASSEDDANLERSEIEQMLARRVDALILASTQSNPETVRRMQEQKLPYVLLDRKIAGVPANFVGIDDVMAGELATTHLLEVGCKTIAHIGGSDVSTAVDRQAGYSATLVRHGMSLPPEYIVNYGRGGDSGDVAGYNGMKRLLQLNPRPDGVFCLNDPVAMGAMRAVVEAGLRIPADVAIVGCGNVHYDDLLIVPLTSVDQDSRNLGERAAKLAMSIIKRKSEAAPKDGFAQNLTEGIIRVRYRNAQEKPVLMNPGQIYKFTIDTWSTSNVFLKGHQLRLEISSSNFPRFDRNPNTGEASAAGQNYVPAANTIYHDSEHPSVLVLPVVGPR